jgi:hypothetical protein
MGDWRWEIGDWRLEIGDGRWEMGDGRWEMNEACCAATGPFSYLNTDLLKH